MERFAKKVNDYNSLIFSRKAQSYMFDKVVTLPLHCSTAFIVHYEQNVVCCVAHRDSGSPVFCEKLF